jgi:hypothetical protein
MIYVYEKDNDTAADHIHGHIRRGFHIFACSGTGIPAGQSG